MRVKTMIVEQDSIKAEGETQMDLDDQVMEPSEETIEEPYNLGSQFSLLISSENGSDLDNVYKSLQDFFASKENVTKTSAETFISQFLLAVLKDDVNNMQSEKRRFYAENLLFGDSRRLIQKVLIRVLKMCFDAVPHELVSAEEGHQILLFLLETSSKLRNIPKFLDYLLKAVKISKIQHIKLEQIFKDKLAEFSVKMTVNQNLAIWTTMYTVLKEQCSAENSSVCYPRVHFAAEIASISMLNSKLADHSIREDTIDLVVSNFKTLEEDLKLLTQQALQTPDKLVTPLLRLAFAYGELDQLLLLYNQPYAEKRKPLSPHVESEEEQAEDLFNFEYLHEYASPKEWKQLADVTLQENMESWASLIVQRIRFLVLFSSAGKKSKMVERLLQFLMDHYSSCEALWLNNVKYLLPFMTAKQMQVLGEKIVFCDTWKDILNDTDMLEKRHVQMMIVNCVLRRILDTSRKRKADCDTYSLNATTRTVLQTLSQRADLWINSVERNVKSVVEWLRKCAQQIRQAILPSTEGVVAEVETTDLSSILQPLQLIDQLPLEYATGALHSTILVALLGLLLSLEQSADKERVWMTIVRLLDHHLDKNSSLFDYFPVADFLNWALRDAGDLTKGSVIFTSLLSEAIKSPSRLQSCADWLKAAELKTNFKLLVTVLTKVTDLLTSTSHEDRKKVMLEMVDTLRGKFLDAASTFLQSGGPVSPETGVSLLKGSLSLLQVHIHTSPKKTKIVKSAPTTAPVVGTEDVKDPPAAAVDGVQDDVEMDDDDDGRVTNDAAVDSAEVKSAPVETVATVQCNGSVTGNADSAQVLLSKLMRLVRVAESGIVSADDTFGSCSADFLTFLFANQDNFGGFLPVRMRSDVWNAYRASSLTVRWQDRLIQDLIVGAKEKQLLTMIDGMLEDLHTASLDVSAICDDSDVGASTMTSLERVSRFLQHLISADMERDKRSGVRTQAIQTALPLLQHIVLSRCRTGEDTGGAAEVVPCISVVMDVYLAFLHSGKSYGYPQHLSSALNLCLALPLDGSMRHSDFEQVFTIAYKVVHYMLTRHEEITADRIPVLLQVLRKLLRVTAERSDQARKAGDDEVSDLTQCANRLSRLASMINKQRLRYRRVAAYLVADVMDQFRKRSFYPSVKHDLLTALHHLLDILDQHASRYLLSVLPPGVRELFRHEYEQFTKFYRFKGKV